MFFAVKAAARSKTRTIATATTAFLAATTAIRTTTKRHLAAVRLHLHRPRGPSGAVHLDGRRRLSLLSSNGSAARGFVASSSSSSRTASSAASSAASSPCARPRSSLVPAATVVAASASTSGTTTTRRRTISRSSEAAVLAVVVAARPVASVVLVVVDNGIPESLPIMAEPSSSRRCDREPSSSASSAGRKQRDGDDNMEELADNSSGSNDVIIESLHRDAIERGSTTYVDPTTGFTVFTELMHLKRGYCCGSQCRHCPYGWANVRGGGSDDDDDAPPRRRQAKVQSKDRVAIDRLLSRYRQLQLQREAATDTGAAAAVGGEGGSSSSASHNNGNNGAATEGKTGGRHGGRLTDKNVPYTRGGDKGTSQLLTGERRSKSDAAFEAMGTVDELCATVGVVHAATAQVLGSTASTVGIAAAAANNISNDEFLEYLLDIMSRLFDIGSHVAKPRRHEDDDDDDDDDSASHAIVFEADGVGGGFDGAHIDLLEDWIDRMTNELPELGSFILPTGAVGAAQLHVCRTVCRRAERRVVPLVESGACDPNALKYLNRLSDFFFSAARWVNQRQGHDEVQYRRPARGSKQRDRVTVKLQDD